MVRKSRKPLPPKPCPACGCTAHKLAYELHGIALACYRCEHTGPAILCAFPFTSRDTHQVAAAWDAAIVRAGLPDRLSRRLPPPGKQGYVTPDYVKPATLH